MMDRLKVLMSLTSNSKLLRMQIQGVYIAVGVGVGVCMDVHVHVVCGLLHGVVVKSINCQLITGDCQMKKQSIGTQMIPQWYTLHQATCQVFSRLSHVCLSRDSLPSHAARRSITVRSRKSLLSKHGVEVGRSIIVSSPKSMAWTHTETENLLKGVKMFGVGKWAQILHHFDFASHRKAISLKDKWRNLQGRRYK